MQPLTHASLHGRQLQLIVAALFLAGAVLRTAIAVRHYHQPLIIVDDPSIRELEQVNALFEGVFVILLVAHAGAVFWLSRKPFTFSWPLALGAALICGWFLGGALREYWVLASPGVYAVVIIIAVAILSRLTSFDWPSLYAGALVGSATVWYGSTQTLNVFVGLFVVGPCVGYALIGAILGRLITKALSR